MRFFILIFITAIINLGDGIYWKDLRSTRSVTKPYKGHTLGKEMYHKLKQNNLQRNRQLKKPKDPGQGPLKSLYLKSGHRYFPRGGAETGDNERKIDGDISLVDSRRRAPFIMPLQYTRAGGQHGHGHKHGHGPSKRPHHKRKTTTTTPTPTTTTQYSKKRTKSTPPPTPKRTIYRHWTPGHRYFPHGGVGTGDNEREIDGDISLVDSRRRAPFIMPLQYTRAGGKHGRGHKHKGHKHKGHKHKEHKHRGHRHSKRPRRRRKTTTTPTPMTTTQCSKKRTKFNYKAFFGSRAWGRTNASTPPPTPKRTIYTHWTPDFIGTDVNQWTWMQYTDNKWVVQPIWEEGHTPTDHYLELPTNVPDLYEDVSLKPNHTNATNGTDTRNNETYSDSSSYEDSNDTDSSGEDTESSGNDTDSDVNATDYKKDFFEKLFNITSSPNTSSIDWDNLDKPSANKSEQELLDLWATHSTKSRRPRTTKTHRTRGSHETSAEKVSYLSTIKTLSTPYKKHSRQGTYYRHYRDWIHDHDKRRVQHLALDLMKDAVIKIQQVTGIKDECMHATAFEVGYVIGIIREKYRRLMATYTEIMDKIRQRTRMIAPSNIWNEIRPYHVLIYYEWIHNLERDIDYLLEALDDIPIEELGITEATISFRAKAQEEVEAREIMNIRAQEKLKSQYRQEFLMRRLGLPRNMSTARRRFYNKWPVEDTWDHTPQYW